MANIREYVLVRNVHRLDSELMELNYADVRVLIKRRCQLLISYSTYNRPMNYCGG